MPATSTAQVAAPVDFYDRTTLERALPYLCHDKFGQQRPLPTGSGKNVKFRRYSSLAVATAQLTEGTPPASNQAAVTDITATVAQYGSFIQFSDMVSLTNIDPVLTEFAELNGEQAGQSLDQVYRDILVAGTNVMYSNSKASRITVVDLLAAADLDKALRIMNNNNCTRHTEIIKATTGVGTTPIRPAYFAIVHPDVAFTLDNIAGFTSVEKYASQGPVMEGEIGAYKNLRFIMTTFAKVFGGAGAASAAVKNTAGNTDVYATMIFAKNAYGVTPLKGNGLRNIVKALGSAGASDPLEQYGTSGWKAITTCKILNDAFMLRLESAAAL